MSMLLRRHYVDNTNAKGAPEEVAPKAPVEEKTAETKADSKVLTITPADIKMMNGAKVRKLAKENGIENPEELTVGELKAILTEKYS